MTAGIKANVDGSAAIQVGGVDAITLTSAGAASFVTSPMTIQGGSASAPSLTFSGDTNTGIFSPAADTIAFTEGGTEVARFDSSGRFGIQTTNPLSTLVVSNNANENVEFVSGSAALNGGFLQYINRTSASTRPDMNYYLSSGGGSHKFYTNDLLRASIDSSGNVGIGTTPSVNAGQRGLFVSGFAGGYSALSLGASGGDYGVIGYGIGFTSTGGTYKSLVTDGISWIGFNSGGFQFFSQGSATTGTNYTGTQRMVLTSSGTLGLIENTANGAYIRSANSVSLASGATVTITSFIAGAALIAVYEQSSGDGGLFWANYTSVVSKVVGDGSATDAGTTIAVYKSAASHVTTIKNRYASTRNFTIAVYSADARP